MQPFSSQQIDLVQPEIIVAMGRFAAQVLLDSDQSLRELRGRPHTFGKSSQPSGRHLSSRSSTSLARRKEQDMGRFVVGPIPIDLGAGPMF